MKEEKNISKERIREWLRSGSSTEVDEGEVKQSEEALLNMMASYAKPAPKHKRQEILNKLKGLNAKKKNRKALDLHQLPILDEESNFMDWEDVVKGIDPPATYENIHLHSLESNDKRDLFVVWVKEFIPEEVHDDLLESFLILEGSCECLITNEEGETRIVHMRAGDFITMKLGEVHDIHITSPKPAKAILQWIKLAA